MGAVAAAAAAQPVAQVSTEDMLRTVMESFGKSIEQYQSPSASNTALPNAQSKVDRQTSPVDNSPKIGKRFG